MDFELSDEQIDIQKAAFEFARGEFDPDLAFELDQAGQFPETIWKKASRLGFIGLHYPEEFGGQGLGLLEQVLVIESFCRVDSGIGSALATVDLGSEVVLKFGSYEQKKSFLPLLTKGEKQMSIAFSESEDGKDFSSVSTSAEKKDREYLIHGKKRFVPHASRADLLLLLCKEPREGWLTLIVGKEADGLEIQPVERMGLRVISYGDLSIKGVRIPIESRIGPGGDGLIQANHCEKIISIRSAAQALGMAQGAFDQAVQYARQREQFGRKLSQFQVIQHKLAEMAVGIEVARLLTYKSATDGDQGKIDPEFLSITQLEVGRRLTCVVDEALQIFGGYGYMAEQAIEHYFRDAWATLVDLGTEEDLKDVIAGRILGDPKGA